HPAVDQAVVIVREDRPGDERLVAYVIPEPGATMDPAALRAYTAEALPGYMVPSAVVTLAEFPLSASTKVDKRALPAPDYQEQSAGRAPRGPREQLLCDLFAEVLGLDRVSIDDDFFALGGHSLLATRLASRIRSAFGAEVSVRTVFEAPTVARLAPAVDNAASRPAPARVLPRPDRIPLSFGQRRLWFLNRFEGANAIYNMPLALRLTGDLDVAALEAALGDLVARHESLRTVFAEDETGPHQVIVDAEVARPGLTPQPSSAERIDDDVALAARYAFDLAAEVPLRVWLFEVSPREHVLLLVLHHIVADGWSMPLLMNDLGAAFRARRDGVEPSWQPLPLSYADYALWQQDVLGDEDDPQSPLGRQLGFWRDALA
ncbi:condensation domain-containing protein, partial [Actinoplanes utahensis]